MIIRKRKHNISLPFRNKMFTTKLELYSKFKYLPPHTIFVIVSKPPNSATCIYTGMNLKKGTNGKLIFKGCRTNESGLIFFACF